MAKKISPNAIKSLSEDWANDLASGLPFSGQAVQTFIKAQFNAKVGHWCWSTSVDDNNYYHLWGFADLTAKENYLLDPAAHADLLLVDAALPISTLKGVTYGAYLWTSVLSNKEMVVSGETLKVKLRFAGVRNIDGERQNLGTAGTLIIQRKTSNTDWTTVALTLNCCFPVAR